MNDMRRQLINILDKQSKRFCYIYGIDSFKAKQCIGYINDEICYKQNDQHGKHN